MKIQPRILAPTFLACLLAFQAQAAQPKTTTQPKANTPPNIIVIYTDDHGYSDLSCQDVFDDVKTPHIDALATGGVRMKNGYCTAPQCVPSRAGLITGRYQTKFGVDANGNNLTGFNEQTTIAQRLKTAGYATGMAGKWHLGSDTKITEHGFDKVCAKAGDHAAFSNIDLSGADIEPANRVKIETYHLDACSEMACSFIDRYKQQPFFLYVAYRAPHVNLDPTQEYLDRFPGEMPERRRKALAMLSAVDDGVGDIVATLQKLDLETNTLIFFASDNGAPLKITKEDAPGGGPGWDGSLNEPMNGEKGMLSEGGIHVPFIAYWKDTLPAGQVYDHPVITLDIAATANQLAGLPETDELDGVNLMPYLTGQNEQPPHDSLYWRWSGQAAIRKANWKYLQAGKRSYLFDLDTDVGETNNLISQNPERATELLADLKQWGQQLSPPGIETKRISRTANAYFDFYLDGKKDARMPSKTGAEPVGKKRRKKRVRADDAVPTNG